LKLASSECFELQTGFAFVSFFMNFVWTLLTRNAFKSRILDCA